MSKQMMAIILAVLCISFSSCKENQQDLYADVAGNYFSIKQYIIDEWNTHSTDPAVFVKKVTVNGKTDSSFENIQKMDWETIINTFVESDISDRSFLGKYKFSQFDDATDNTHDFMYVANDKDLFTQQLLITTDQYTNKVRGIYIETNKSSFWRTTYQKLYYAPMQTIRIKRQESPLIGGKKETTIDYETKS